MNESFLLTLRETAKRTSSELGRSLLREVANQLDVALKELYMRPSIDNMTKVNGLWAVAQRTLDTINQPTDGGHGGALHEPAQLAA